MMRGCCVRAKVAIYLINLFYLPSDQTNIRYRLSAASGISAQIFVQGRWSVQLSACVDSRGSLSFLTAVGESVQRIKNDPSFVMIIGNNYCCCSSVEIFFWQLWLNSGHIGWTAVLLQTLSLYEHVEDHITWIKNRSRPVLSTLGVKLQFLMHKCTLSFFRLLGDHSRLCHIFLINVKLFHKLQSQLAFFFLWVPPLSQYSISHRTR